MVSTTRWDSSSGSSSSSYGGSWDPGQDLKNGGVMGKRGQTFAEPLSAEHEREVARRVLEDLETLYHDSEDESDESGDDFDWDSEWGSEVSSCDGRDKRSAGGMTLEELAVAVNAAIEYHRPAKSVAVDPPVRQSRSDIAEDVVDRSRERHQRPRSRHWQKEASKGSSQREESVLTMFQEMLEKKERHFYSLKATNAVVGVIHKEEEPQECVESRHFAVNQQQQTTARVRDQATETANHPSYSRFDTSFAVAEFNSPLHSPPQSIYDEYVWASRTRLESVAVGPTLADLANSRRRSGRSHTSQPFSASESPWSASSSSSRSSVADDSIRSSRPSTSSRRSPRSSISHCTNGSSSTRNSKRSGNSMSSISRNSSSYEGQTQEIRAERDLSIQETKPKDGQLASVGEIERDNILPAEVSPESEDSAQVPKSPTPVNWELDLSNFAF